MRIRYWGAKSRKQRSELLDEMEQVTGKQLIHHGELSISKDTLKKLRQVSISTVRRMVGSVTHIPQHISTVRKPKRRKQTYLRTIPTKRIAWDVDTFFT